MTPRLLLLVAVVCWCAAVGYLGWRDRWHRLVMKKRWQQANERKDRP